jgi:signal transduction histidine kinase
MRIFYQILENAFKYLDAGNTISLLAHSAGEEILIVYKDDGKGMDAEEATKIFERGFRGGNGKKKNGTGLGLYDVAETVKKYNGIIEGTSRPGEGFSIYIRFPKVVDENTTM